MTTLDTGVRDVVLHGAEAACTVQVISGMPDFVAVRQIKAELLDVWRDECGIPFQPQGPCFESSGRSLIPAGGRIAGLREGIERRNPSFAAYLDA